jgi:hypothetical protein
MVNKGMLKIMFSPVLPGKLASLNRSWQSKEGTYRALGMAGIEPKCQKQTEPIILFYIYFFHYFGLIIFFTMS